MTLPSTEELQRLLDAATPGPWYLHEDETGDPDGTYLYDVKGVMCIAITPIGSGSDYRENDLDLAALAPSLAAEVIRLREENDEMRRGIATAAEKARSHATQCSSIGQAAGSLGHRDVARHLARILEGDQA